MDQTVDKALQDIEHLNVQKKLDLVEKVIQKFKKKYLATDIGLASLVWSWKRNLARYQCSRLCK
jgi:hypothetical protein